MESDVRRKIFIPKLTTIILIYWFLDIVTICIYIVDIFISVHNFTCSFYFEYNSFLRNYYFYVSECFASMFVHHMHAWFPKEAGRWC